MKSAIVILLFASSYSTLCALHPKAFEFYKNSAKKVKENPTIENAVELAGNLSSLTRNIDQTDTSGAAVYKEMQAVVVSIPGHAEYYRDQILQAQERYKTQGGGEAWSDYREKIRNAFQILPHLSSPEGVCVLGELLSNDWVPSGNETAPLSEKFVPLSVSATVTLPKLPILDKPFKAPITNENVADAEAAWEFWYEQIKSGKRTFRFEGDPTEYDLRGPAPGQKIANISRNQKRDDERKTGSDKQIYHAEGTTTIKSDNKPTIIGAILASFTVFAAASWYYLKRPKTQGTKHG